MKALEAFEKTASGNCVLVPSDKLAEMQAEIEALNKTVKRLREDIDLPASDIEEFVLHKYEYFAKCKTIASQQAEIEKLRNWVEMLVEVPFFDEIDHYRGIPVSILRKAEEE